MRQGLHRRRALHRRLPDDIILNDEETGLSQLLHQFETTQSTILGCCKVGAGDVSKYGIVSGERDETHSDLIRVHDITEKPVAENAPSHQAVFGRYIITPDVFDYLELTPNGLNGQIQLTDALRAMSHNEPMYAYNMKGHFYNVGDKMGYLIAIVDYGLRPQRPVKMTLPLISRTLSLKWNNEHKSYEACCFVALFVYLL